MYVCVYIYIYTCIYIYMYTHIQIIYICVYAYTPIPICIYRERREIIYVYTSPQACCIGGLYNYTMYNYMMLMIKLIITSGLLYILYIQCIYCAYVVSTCIYCVCTVYVLCMYNHRRPAAWADCSRS